METRGQRKISSFFAKGDGKRVHSPEDFANPQPKQPRVDRDLSQDDRDLSLTPEQKERIDEKKAEASRLLLQKRSPQGVGQSWMKILNVEFQKPYFLKVGVASELCVYVLYS